MDCEFCKCVLEQGKIYYCDTCEKRMCYNCVHCSDTNIICTWHYCAECGKDLNL